MHENFALTSIISFKAISFNIYTSYPRRRGRHIVRGDFFQKSPLTHFVAAPLQTATASLGCGGVLVRT